MELRALRRARAAAAHTRIRVAHAGVWAAPRRPPAAGLPGELGAAVDGAHAAPGWGRRGADAAAAAAARLPPQVIHVDLVADWYVYGFIRLTVAALVEVGRRRVTPSAFAAAVAAGDRDAFRYAAPASGLCLMEVGYEGDDDPWGGGAGWRCDA